MENAHNNTSASGMESKEHGPSSLYLIPLPRDFPLMLYCLRRELSGQRALGAVTQTSLNYSFRHVVLRIGAFRSTNMRTPC